MNYSCNSTKRLTLKYTSARFSVLNAIVFFVLTSCTCLVLSSCGNLYSENNKAPKPIKDSVAKDSIKAIEPLVLDTILFNQRLVKLTNGDSSGRWPVRTAYPNVGAILPFKRIVAYYGNLYSKQMGVLGEYPPKEMLQRLEGE